MDPPRNLPKQRTPPTTRTLLLIESLVGLQRCGSMLRMLPQLRHVLMPQRAIVDVQLKAECMTKYSNP